MMATAIQKARHAVDVMEGDSVKAKISYFHHWIDTEGMADIESWKNNKLLLKQEDFDKLDANQKEGKYSLGNIESYFTLFESLLAPKSNSLLAVEELHFVKQGSMNYGDKHSEKMQIPNEVAEERANRYALFLGMNNKTS